MASVIVDILVLIKFGYTLLRAKEIVMMDRNLSSRNPNGIPTKHETVVSTPISMSRVRTNKTVKAANAMFKKNRLVVQQVENYEIKIILRRKRKKIIEE